MKFFLAEKVLISATWPSAWPIPCMGWVIFTVTVPRCWPDHFLACGSRLAATWAFTPSISSSRDRSSGEYTNPT